MNEEREEEKNIDTRLSLSLFPSCSTSSTASVERHLPRRRLTFARDDPVFLLAGDGRHRPDGAGDVRFWGKRAGEKRERKGKRLCFSCFFVLSRCIIRFFFSLSTSTPTTPSKKKKKKKNSLRAYAAPRVPLHARAIVLVAWITSASIVALVPLDVWTTLTAAHKSGGAGGRGDETAAGPPPAPGAPWGRRRARETPRE